MKNDDTQSQKFCFSKEQEELIQREADQAAGKILHCIWPQYFDKDGAEIMDQSEKTVKEDAKMNATVNKEKFTLQIGNNVLTVEGGFVESGEHSFWCNGKRYVQNMDKPKLGIIKNGKYLIGFINTESKEPWESQVLTAYQADVKKRFAEHAAKKDKK